MFAFKSSRALLLTATMAVATLVVAGACRDSVTPEVWLMEKEGQPTNPVAGKVATPAPSVRITVDGAGRAGVTVNWSTSGGSATASTTTDADGLATTAWTLGTTAGSQTLTATSGNGVSPATWTAAVAPDRPARVRFTPDSAVLDAIGDSVRLNPAVTDQHGNTTAVAPTFALTPAGIATLTAGGYAKASANGTATVTATADTAHGTFRVIVRQAVTSLTMSPRTPSALASIGDTLRFTTVARDRLAATVASAIVQYASSDTSIVRVDTTGKITAKANGQVFIRVSVAGSAARDSVSVTVAQVAASVTLNTTVLEMSAGDSVQLTATVKDARGSLIADAPVAWTTNNANIAVVSAQGFVRGENLGAATITATSGAASSAATATIVAGAPATATLSAAKTVFASLGDTTTVAAVLKDGRGNVVVAPVTWSSSAAAVTVNAAGLATAVQNGTAWLKALSGNAKDSVLFTVQQVAATVVIAPTGVTVSLGDSAAFVATVRDARAQVFAGAIVTWTSRAPAVLTVSSVGYARPLADTTTSVRLIASSGAASDSVVVTIAPVAVASVRITPDSAAMLQRDTLTLTGQTLNAAAQPLLGRAKNWVSLDTLIARVSPAGLVTAVDTGRARIVLSSEGKADTAAVRVSRRPVGSVTVSVDSVTVVSGDSASLAAVVKDDTGLPLVDRPLVWTTRDTTIAVVNTAGLVHGRAAGLTWVVGTSEGVSDSARVRVLSLLSGCVETAHVLGATTNGAWESNDCTGGAGGAVPFDRYALNFASQTFFRATLSGAAGKQLLLRQGSATGPYIAFMPRAMADTVNPVFVNYLLAPGAYVLEVMAPNAGERSSYSLITSTIGQLSCDGTITWATPGVSVAGNLVSGDCIFGGAFVDRALVLVPAGKRLRATLTTPSIRPVIAIRNDSTGSTPVVSRQFRGSPGTVSTQWTTRSGTTFAHEIIASTFASGETGSYTLSIDEIDASNTCTADSVLVGTTTDAGWDATDCMDEFNRAFDRFVLSPSSTAFRANLTGPSGKYLHGLVNGTSVARHVAPDTSALVTHWFLRPGAVEMQAGAPNGGGGAGYRLQLIADTNITACRRVWTQRGALIPGQKLEATDCAVSGTYEDRVLVNLDAGTTFTVEMQTGAFANSLVVRTVPGVVLASDVRNTPGIATVTWTTTFAGTYEIVATSATPGATGNYVLTLPLGVGAVSASPDSIAMVVGDTLTAVAAVTDSASNPWTGTSVTWTSLDTTVATVSSAGTITAVGVGSTAIVVSAEVKSDTVLVLVQAGAVASVVIVPDSSSTVVGDTLRFHATLLSAGGDTITGRAITWSSSDTTLARVDTSGLVTALGVGSPVITALREGQSDSVVVVIALAPVATVTIAPDTMQIVVADTAPLAVVLRDVRNVILTGRAIAWTSADTAIASVSASGLVTGHSVGATWISALSEGISDSSYVSVSPMPVANVYLVPDSTSGYIGVGRQLAIVALGANGDTLTGRSIVWTSLDGGIATVDSLGVVTGSNLGLARVVATIEGKADTAKVLVRSPITRIVITPDSTTLTAIGATELITAVAHDTLDAPMTGVVFTWTAANPLVAQFDSASGESRTVAAVGAGFTQVVAHALGMSGAAVVRVGQFAAVINTSPDTVFVTVGGRVTPLADVRDAANQPIVGAQTIWHRSNSTFTIDSLTGLVTGVSLGAGHAWTTLDGVTSDSVRVVVTSSAPPQVAFGARTFAVGKASSIQVPVYLSTAPATSVLVRLSTSDTTKAKFSAASLSFGPGQTQANATLNGIATGTVSLTATDSAGTFGSDIVSAQVQIAVSLLFPRLTANFPTMSVPDTFPGSLHLSDPAPPGGLYFTIDGKGIVKPSQSTLFVPAGNLAASLTITGIQPSANFTITASANGTTAAGFAIVAVYAGQLGFSGPGQLTPGHTRTYLAKGQRRRGNSGQSVSLRMPAKVSHPVNATLTSSNPAIGFFAPASVRIGPDSAVYGLDISGLQVGQTIITASAPGWASGVDTVIVTSPRLRISSSWPPFNDTLNIYPTNQSPSFIVSLSDSLGNDGDVIDTIHFSTRTSDTTVLRFQDPSAAIPAGQQATGTPKLIPVGLGSAWAYVEGPGLLPDSIHVTVRQPKLTFDIGASAVVSIGMTHSNSAYLIIPGSTRDTVRISFTSSDSSVVVPPPTRSVAPTSGFPIAIHYVSLSGTGPGTAQVIASAPGFLPDTIVVTTATPRLFVYSYPSRLFGNLADTVKMPAFGSRDVGLSLVDSIRSNAGILPNSDLVVHFSIDDTTVARIDSAQVTVRTYVPAPGKIVAVGGGMTWLRATANGVFSDSMRVLVEAAPLTAAVGSTQRLAPFQHSPGGGYDTYVSLPNTRSVPVVARYQNLNPAVATMDADSVVIPAGQTYASLGWTAHALGEDTVIVTAVGYAPDTMVLRVEPGRLRHYSGGAPRMSYYTTSNTQPVYFGMQPVSQLSNAPSTRTETIRVSSTDSTVIVPDSGYVHVVAGLTLPTYRFNIVGPGTARIVIADSLGNYASDTSAVFTVTAPPLYFANYGWSMGMRQQTQLVSGNPQEFVYVPEAVLGAPLVVHLASSDTSVATVPDSVVIPVGQTGAWYTITTHDTTGTIAITANAVGHLQGRFDLTVTRPVAGFSTNSHGSLSPSPRPIYVTLRDSIIAYRSLRTTENLVLTLTSSNPSVAVVDSAVIVIPAGQAGGTWNAAWRAVGVGTATLTLKDERTGFIHYIQTEQVVTVVP
jgi:hypothetical protein